MSYENTTLWKSAFTSTKNDGFSKARERFRVAYYSMREKAAKLVGLIAKDMPDYTVHDITHLDALWELASQIAGPSYTINPSEAFVLGGAMLLHDAGMTLAAFPDGLTGLRATQEWKDTVGLLARQRGVSKGEPAIEKVAISEVLRRLHAKQARYLGVQKWDSADGKEADYIIDDPEFRALYGETIGLIARSHWLSVGELETEFPRKLGAIPSGSPDWTVDGLKLACLLRVADASHVDSRRAPRFLRTLTRPPLSSDYHWIFQGRLPRPIVEREALVFSAGGAFPENDSAAWWICFDTVNMIDRELSEVDALLLSTGRVRFIARRVEGAGNPSLFRRFVATDGWEPVDTKLHVSDVPALVATLGGKALYGNDLAIPLRELIQNAADAVRAKRRLTHGKAYNGRITVRLINDGGRSTLEVEDDGVGMSEYTLVHVLLDFGRSLWRSPAVQSELPGLAASDMTPTGRFGIGFFSVFMLGQRIRVYTRRYDLGVSDQLTLEFSNGTQSRPILRRSIPPGYVENGGTCVAVELDKDPKHADGLLGDNTLPQVPWTSSRPLVDVIRRLCPCLDVTIEFSDEVTDGTALKADDWKTIPGHELLERIGIGEKRLAHLVHDIVGEDGELLGRAAPELSAFGPRGVVVEGGFRVCPIDMIAGVVLGVATNAARTEGLPSTSSHAMSQWASKLRPAIAKRRDLDSEDKLYMAAVVAAMGGTTGQLPIVQRGKEYWSQRQFVEHLRKSASIFMINSYDLLHDSSDPCSEQDFEHQFRLSSETFVYPLVGALKSTIFEPIRLSEWPYDRLTENEKVFMRHETRGIHAIFLKRIVEKVWRESLRFASAERVVGSVDGDDIERSGILLARTPSPARRQRGRS